MKGNTAEYLTQNNLWDTEWLEEKHPYRFKKRNKKYNKGRDNKFHKK